MLPAAWPIYRPEQGNDRLKRLVGDRSLEKLVLRDIASGEFFGNAIA
jgi:hypothetical protein